MYRVANTVRGSADWVVMKPVSWIRAGTVVLAALLLLVSAASSPAGAQQPPPWQFLELQPLAGDSSATTAVFDINNHGYSVGSSGTRPVYWDPNGMPTALPLPTGTVAGRALAINEWGLIVGSASPAPGRRRTGESSGSTAR